MIYRYLFGKQIPEELSDRYVEAVSCLHLKMPDEDSDLWSIIMRRTWMLPYIESYHALANPQSGIRKRVQLLNAIAEGSPHEAERFLPQKESPFYLIRIGLVGTRAVLSCFFGWILNLMYG